MILYYILVTLHFVVCTALIVIVLLQAGKGGGMAGIFGGGGGSDQIFSAPSGMAFIKKVTVACAVIFMVTSLTLTLMSSRISMQSVVNQVSNIPIAAPQQPSK